MFMTAESLRDHHQTVPGDFPKQAYGDGENESEIHQGWDTKHRTAHKPGGLRSEVDAAGGVEDSVLLSHRGMDVTARPELTDGHHRVAAAFARNPRSLLPVRHQI